MTHIFVIEDMKSSHKIHIADSGGCWENVEVHSIYCCYQVFTESQCIELEVYFE